MRRPRKLSRAGRFRGHLRWTTAPAVTSPAITLPIGYGLSYTTVAYSGLSLPGTPINAESSVNTAVTVTNTGNLAGDEELQLYLKFPSSADTIPIAVRGFERIHLGGSQSRHAHFELSNRDLSMVTEAAQPIITRGDYLRMNGVVPPDSK